MHLLWVSQKQSGLYQSTRRFLGKANTITLNVFPFLLLLPTLYAEHDIIWYGISLWPIGFSCPGCVPSQLFVHLNSTRWQSGTRSRKDLDSV